MSEGNETMRDPDYELSETAKHQKKMREDIEKNQTINKVKGIIKREFQKELEFREKQLEMIQQRLNKAAKSLHLLRYCLVNSYYNKNEHQISSKSEEFPNIDKQSRIHPAVKRLLGSNSNNVYSNLGLRKKKHRDSNVKIKKNAEIAKPEETRAVEVKLEPSGDDKVDDVPKNVNLIRNRKLYKHQIVVGNISKWAPSESPEDNSTHKWMVYVRGPKEYPDISHIVQKAVFYLHPSYKPNDVIEVTKSPFHLSRRGWGEFPLRVQLSFHGELNKPVDVIHALKLDRTRTGRQTLGNETIIELSLYDMNKGEAACKRNGFYDHINTEQNLVVQEREKFERVTSHEAAEKSDESVSFCQLINSIDLDHNYCQRNDRGPPKSGEAIGEKTEEHGNVAQNNGDLMGARNKRKLSGPPSSNASLNKRIKTEFFEDPSGEDIDMERYEIYFDSYGLRNLDQALGVLFKKLPLVSEIAHHGSYKWMYPFTAVSVREFLDWNVAKQFSSEWARARSIRKILVTSKFPGSQTLTTKNVLQFGRARGFAFPVTYDIYRSMRGKSFDYSRYKSERGPYVCASEQDAHIDVINTCGNKSKREDSILMKWTDNYKHERSYVKQAALDVGVLLKQEQIVPGVLYSTSERIIYECTKYFAEDLIRRSLSWAVTNERFDSDTSLVLSHIIKGLHHREEYEKILSFNKDFLQY